MTSVDKTWLIDNAAHLRGFRLKFQHYAQRSAQWDHDHCAACGAKFSEADEPGIHRSGYATCDDYPKGAGYEWVCEDCFAALKQDLQWQAA